MWKLDGPVELLDLDERLTVVRQGLIVDRDVTYVDGVAQALHAPSQFVIVCTVQPMGGKDLLLVPEAFRDKETYWLWSRQDGLKVDVSDIVLREGKAFQIQTAEDWGSYSRSMMVAIDVGLHPGTDGPIYGLHILPETLP